MDVNFKPDNFETELLKIISKNIIRLRGGLGLSQERLAKKAGISRGTVGKLERKKSIELDNFLKIAKALGVNPADLFISDEDRQEISYKHKLLMDKLTEPIKPKKEVKK